MLMLTKTVFIFAVCFPNRAFSPKQLEFRWLLRIWDCQEDSQNQLRGGKMVPLRFAERSCLWHHSHSPMISLTLLLCWVHAVPLVCLYVHICVRVFFSHLLWFATKHCNLEPTPSFLFLRVPWLSLTERCVLYWHAFLYAGALNSTSGPPWITNDPRVGPQTAHCLTCAVFLVLSITVRVSVEAGSCLCVSTMYLQSLPFCVYFTDTTPSQASPVWLTLQRTSASNSRARYRAR